MSATIFQEQRYSVILVKSTSHALHIEKILSIAGIPCVLVPVPRRLGSDCGTCVRIKQKYRETVVDVLADVRTLVQSIHDI